MMRVKRRRGWEPRTGNVERLEISSIGAGGEGVGRLADGRAAFVHRTAPGDVVEMSIETQRARWVRGRLLRVLEPSTERRDPPCPHYAECGGCTLEHILYDAQLAHKSRIVADALQRIGGLAVAAPEVIASPLEFRYRNRVSFTLRRGGTGRVHAGFHALHDPSRIVPIDGRCLLPETTIGVVWDALRDAWGPDANRLPAGERLRLTLRASSAGGVSLLIDGGNTRGRPAELLDAVEGLAAIWHRPENADAELLAGASRLPETWGTETFDLGGTAFLQVNRHAAGLLEDHVMTSVGDLAGLRVVDAYCGIGFHSRRMASAAARVTGIESNPEAVRIAAEAAVPNVVLLEGRVEDLLPSTLPADVLIVNPPRSGLDTSVIEAILAAPPPRVVYVSCDPATLARDLKRLGGRYEIADLRCFDLFPQTAHVETVMTLGAKG
jgi:23S rRNA (uracil1939-C5)-methyltransferase